MPRVTVPLSEAEMRELADEARQQGLPTETVARQALVEHLRTRARERAWREQLGSALDALHASLPPLDPAEVEAEITAARAEVAAARAARRP